MKERGKLHRRLVGALSAWLPALGLEQVEDPRWRRGRRWPLATLLRATLVGLVAGRHSVAQAEALVAEMAPAVRQRLKLPARLADTTLRDLLVRLKPWGLRQVLYRAVKAAWRRGALAPVGLPLNVVTLDGKGTALPVWDDHYAQRQRYDDGRGAYGLLRTVTAVLTSARPKPVLDATPIPAGTNEMGIFTHALAALVGTYGRLFDLVTYDAGACSLANARAVVAAGKSYLFALKNEARFLMQQALAAVGPQSAAPPLAQTEDVLSDKRVVRRTLYACQARQGYKAWGHLRTVLRVRSETLDPTGRLVATQDRYFISNLPHLRLTWAQWLLLVRCHWGVENGAHWTLDAIYREDERPWIVASPKGALAVLLLRRVAYTLTTLWRTVTQRSDDKRQTPWRTIVRWFYNALIATTDAQLAGLRPREAAPATR